MLGPAADHCHMFALALPIARIVGFVSLPQQQTAQPMYLNRPAALPWSVQ
jgi:hypothetical protein